MSKINLAGCAILNDKNEILLLHRIKNDCYELPGGKVEDDETHEQTIIRELKEELLCNVEVIKPLGNKDFEENEYIMGYYWYLAKIQEGSVPHVGEPDKYDHFKYIPLHNVIEYNLSPNMKNFVQEVIAKGLL